MRAPRVIRAHTSDVVDTALQQVDVVLLGDQVVKNRYGPQGVHISVVCTTCWEAVHDGLCYDDAGVLLSQKVPKTDDYSPEMVLERFLEYYGEENYEGLKVEEFESCGPDIDTCSACEEEFEDQVEEDKCPECGEEGFMGSGFYAWVRGERLYVRYP